MKPLLAPLLLLALAPPAPARDPAPASAAPEQRLVGTAALPTAGDPPEGPLGGELPTGLHKFDDALFTPPTAPPPEPVVPAAGSVPAAMVGGFNILDPRDGEGGGEGGAMRWTLPVPGYVTSPYGKRRLLPVYRYKFVKVRNKKGKLTTRKRRVRVGRRLHIHKGIDLKAHTGDPIQAVSAGVVSYAGRAQGYGNCVYIDHPDGLQTRYAHASRVLVREGDSVEPGQVIALAGSTGRSTGPHLHFEIRREGEPLNPLPYLEAARVHEEGNDGEGEGGEGDGGDGGDDEGE